MENEDGFNIGKKDKTEPIRIVVSKNKKAS
jgi:hypothetical protein